MDQTSSNAYCHKTFISIENHYKGCAERNGADYQHLLSKRTLDNTSNGKARKFPCPKCGKRFIHLEAHLRNNVTSTTIPLPIEEYTRSAVIPTPPISETSSNAPSSLLVPSSPAPVLLNRARLSIPLEQLDELDGFIQKNITPSVLHEGNVNVLHHAITHSLYTYLVSRFVAMPVKLAANAVEGSTCQHLK